MSKKKYVVLSACFDPSSEDGGVLKQGDFVCLDDADAGRLVRFGRLKFVEDGAGVCENSSEGSDGAKPKKPKRGRSSAASGDGSGESDEG